MVDSMPVEQVEDGLCPCYTPLAISSISHEIRFTLYGCVENAAWEKARPWAKRLSWQTQEWAGEKSGFFSILLEVQGVRLLPKSGLPMMPVLSSSSHYGTQIQ